ncbi:hypothetical protein Cgig2_008259 [Carnegiea gigantea]|uniref:At1g61320/AtMIF1 LRR domain-containing protein n=1 Tax=Carnegiea gigantea TaxID=171969 RepID=A0A9Q1QV39_9CARY|nr:hypothetical protein Cgig2_008259 [Carnegiea gigantea]
MNSTNQRQRASIEPAISDEKKGEKKVGRRRDGTTKRVSSLSAVDRRHQGCESALSEAENGRKSFPARFRSTGIQARTPLSETEKDDQPSPPNSRQRRPKTEEGPKNKGERERKGLAGKRKRSMRLSGCGNNKRLGREYPDQKHSHLKEVEVRKLRDDRHSVELLVHVVKNAVSLERLSVQFMREPRVDSFKEKVRTLLSKEFPNLGAELSIV